MNLIDLLAATGKTSSGSPLLLILIAIFGGLYFLFIRPRQKQQRQQREQGKQVEVGDEIITIGGVYGVVVDIDDEHVTIATGQDSSARPLDGAPTRLTFVKAAINRKVEPKESEDAAPGEVQSGEQAAEDEDPEK